MTDAVLAGITVIDLTQNVAGPFCTQILGDLGADIIKIERPGSGDDTRAWKPPAVGDQSSTFLALNRNKRSVCIDLDSSDGQQVIRRLAAKADVFVHSLKPGSAERRGLGADQLRADHPALIYSAISAFGQRGPLAALPGYDPLMQAFTGIMSTTGAEGQEPSRVGPSLIDMGTGLWSALGILAGLLRRTSSGVGANVEASLLDTGVSWMTIFAAHYMATGQQPRRLGSAMAMTAPYELFDTADGKIFIAAGNDRLFRAVCAALGVSALAEEQRFATNPQRVIHRAELHAALEAQTLALSTASLVEALRAAGAPCSPLHDIAAMVSNDQVIASGMISDLPLDVAPDHRVIGLPLLLDGVRGIKAKLPPALGEHTDECLRDIGISADDLQRWKADGTVA